MKNKFERVKNDFMAGRIKGCRSYFESNGFYTEAGYCYFVMSELKKAKAMFEKTKDFDPRAVWGLFLVQLITGVSTPHPTYFSIRNYLEIDLNLLIMYCNGDYLQKILRYADYMFFYNPECYKFIGRVFWANGYINQAKFYLQKAKDRFYKDPELHYIMAYIAYYNDNNIIDAKRCLSICLDLLPDYSPAVKLLDKISK